MAARPVLFPMANPIPEIAYEDVITTRPDAVVGTGRSDYPNQVNNVLGFPFIFRGALDARASTINEEMKIAATMALVRLAKEPCIKEVEKAYGGQHYEFGPDYVIPKPFDPRVFVWESYAVAEAAINTGVARRQLNLNTYRQQLEERLLKMR